MEKLNFKIILNWVLVGLWAGFIFYLSNQPGLRSSFSDLWDLILRKTAHMTEYFILTWLLCRALNLKDRKQTILWSVLVAFLYAVSDEWHQGFVQNRFGSIKDVLIDSVGILGLARVWWKK